MNKHEQRVRQAADLIVFEAIAHAKTYSVTEDVTAAATGILVAAIALLNPAIAKDRDRMARLILGENE